ncbi:shufflon system plasmid conjugative transfer pilus tip adhesin PilV [Enterobacter hormaechei]|uniref:shufflon system plasmid conjugative transfer pilus tip adhesin PilV n=1 Tax=Enterobacter hormaechei TaxID=158836 RepID=UPI00223C83DC|nr:shufflon system plasmid conjugative transfer pilus tip adhesin PilV [Enterobacter hormaechei]
MFLKRNCQGFTLIELILTLAVIAAISFISFQSMNRDFEDKQAAAIGEQIRNIGDSVNNYIVNHYDVLSKRENSAGTTQDVGPRICATATQTCEITTQTLVNEGMLPPVFNGKNVYGSGYKIIIARKGSAPYWNISALVATDTPLSRSGSIRYDLLGKAMQTAGIDSGMTRTSSTKVDGYKGSWSATQTEFPNINKQGLLVYIAGYGSNSYSAFLRRDGTLPMTGDLNMGTKNIYGAANITASGKGIFGGEVEAGAWVHARNGYGDVISLGGDSSTNDYEIRLGADKPLSIHGSAPVQVNVSGSLRTGLDLNADRDITSGGSIKASGNITSSQIITGQYLKANQVIVSGTICSDNGLLARDNAGQIFSCVNSKWQLVGDQPGTIKMWGAITAPDSWLELNGQAFDKLSNPILTSLYPSGKLPDFRGQFVRAWDHGRGIDSESGRGILSEQNDAIRNINGYIKDMLYQSDIEAQSGTIGYGVFRRYKYSEDKNSSFYTDSVKQVSNPQYADRIDFDASRQVPTASENRPKNIAVMYIIKKG